LPDLRPKVELAKHKTKQAPSLPSKEEVLSFIRERSGKVGTREIARAFGLKNAARAELKRMLRDLADTGAVENRRKKLHQPGALPPVTLADVTGRDSDGELAGRRGNRRRLLQLGGERGGLQSEECGEHVYVLPDPLLKRRNLGGGRFDFCSSTQHL